jgi:hypothetical protein
MKRVSALMDESDDENSFLLRCRFRYPSSQHIVSEEFAVNAKLLIQTKNRGLASIKNGLSDIVESRGESGWYSVI